MTLRDPCPALANKAYFNYGGQGPLPDSALEAIIASWRRSSNGWFVRRAKLPAILSARSPWASAKAWAAAWGWTGLCRRGLG